jgi:hypothetical protein
MLYCTVYVHPYGFVIVESVATNQTPCWPLNVKYPDESRVAVIAVNSNVIGSGNPAATNTFETVGVNVTVPVGGVVSG